MNIVGRMMMPGVLAAVLCACAGEAPALRGGAASVDALGRGVVAALAAGDTAALAAARTTAEEHNMVLWPHFPAGRDGAMPVEAAWENIQLRNAAAQYEWLGSFRGRRVEYQSAACTGAVEEYGPFQILRGCSVRVRDVETNRVFELRPFDRVVRLDGAHKIIRYVEVD